MPGLLQRDDVIWSKQRDDVTFDQLQKFWTELPPHARQELLRIDKQTLFEQSRKNLYCSRCNGLLLEGFSQIIMYGKSLQQEGASLRLTSRRGTSKTEINKDSDDVQDPSIHPWGGLTTSRDGILTLHDYFIDAKSLKALQNVFDSARARERERELLYPDACGGGGRGWISQGMANNGRGHGTRDTCALHTARLSCDTVVNFWSALSEETRFSLLRMKEEDFIERLMYRFDSKSFCRDCRRNVIREFKELKELKRMRREPRCTSWFCVADTAFQYEVSEDMVQADWHQSFTDTVGTYHHFEWAIGTGEGKSDILDFEDVGRNVKVQVNGLELGDLSACFITLRAWKLDGRSTELSVKAHALKGQPCVHRRLIVGDGFVTITKGESIRRFFEHAEEAEEEEDDDAMDKDGNELDVEGSYPQKHAKSPELAREFLLDAATVIFKEQVVKAFREDTARQNAHSIFVCLALKLLEERVHVACKEIITLEKQIKLLEEEEREKREEEERKERRRTKEREKKLRRKERLKGKDREREEQDTEPQLLHSPSPTSVDDSSMSTHDEPPSTLDSGDSISEPGDSKDEQSSNVCIDSNNFKCGNLRHQCHDERELDAWDGKDSFVLEQSKSSRRKLKFRKDSFMDQASKWYDKHQSIISNESSFQYDEPDTKLHGFTRSFSRSINAVHRPSRGNPVKTNAICCGSKPGEKFHCPSNRLRDRYGFHSCGCNQNGDHTAKDGYHISSTRSTKLVWEPMDARKKFSRNGSDHEVTLKTASKVDQLEKVGFARDENGHQRPYDILKSPDDDRHQNHNDSRKNTDYYSKDGAEEEVDSCPMSNSCELMMNSSSSDNCSSCLSEGDSSLSSSSAQNLESSSTSDSEDASQQSDRREISTFTQDSIIPDDAVDCKLKSNGGNSFTNRTIGANFPRDRSPKTVFDSGSGIFPSLIMGFHEQNIQVPIFPSPTVGCLNQSAASWSSLPANGLVTNPQHNPYVFPAPLGYGLQLNHSSEFQMQYNSLRPSRIPVVTVGQHPLYQVTNRAGAVKSKEQANGAAEQRPCSNGLLSSKPLLVQKGGAGSAAKSHHDGPSFSLFHFGGPMAGAAGYHMNSASSRENTGGISLQTCSKETTIEEYSLFSANNGARFSFF